MSWSAPFVIYRLDNDGKLHQVYQAQDLKDAKYWLTYIAEAGDVLCKTPAHPRHTGETPAYWSHKESSGKPATNEEAWRQLAASRNFNGEFPSEQANLEESCSS
ncbi:MAG: hypothetical protein D6719_03450 [Candidatus Dadabacteria bacterium]|nr:MAG: hypothetical protein D6719_03450 [Candidatus Dadabacteria bacterium]